MKYLYIYTDPILRIVDIYAYTMNRYHSLINLCLHVLNELIFTLVLSAKTVLWLPLSQICPRSRFWKSVSISFIFFFVCKNRFQKVLKKKLINEIENKYDDTSIPAKDQGVLSWFLLHVQRKAKPKLFILINISKVFLGTLLHYNYLL